MGVSVCYPAFDTPTGLPYGTINLLYGVPPGEIPITCTACCASFLVEFGTLSRLTGVSVGAGHGHCGRGCSDTVLKLQAVPVPVGDPVFEDTALRATDAIWQRRTPIGLVCGLCEQLTSCHHGNTAYCVKCTVRVLFPLC